MGAAERGVCEEWMGGGGREKSPNEVRDDVMLPYTFQFGLFPLLSVSLSLSPPTF